MNIFSDFLEEYRVTSIKESKPGAIEVIPPGADQDFINTISLLGGKLFNDGLYRVYAADQVQHYTALAEKVFPEYLDKILVFGTDWLGRQFAIDFRRSEGGKPQILLLEIGAGEAMQIPCTIVDFHNDELVDFAEEALALNFFNEWMDEVAHEAISFDECVGYKVPLFLGGKDTIDNLETINLDVYIDLCGQLRSQALELSDGQTIGDISI